MARGLVFIFLVWFLHVSTTLASEPVRFFKFTLKKGEVIQGTVVSQDSKAIVIEYPSGMRLKVNKVDILNVVALDSLTIKNSENKSGSHVSRKYELEDLKGIPQLSYGFRDEQTNEKKNSKLYGGKGEDFWVSEVMRLALKSRRAEERHDSFYRECRPNAEQTKSSEQFADQSPCTNAKHVMAEIEAIRREYGDFMSRARRASVPVAWLESHYKWVRWSEEWKN